MSESTPNFNLVKPGQNELYDVDMFNGNMEIIDEEMAKPPLTVNNIQPTPGTRNIPIQQVALADNLASDIAQINYGEFIERTSGGDSSIEDGYAALVAIKGNLIRTGYVERSIEHTESEGLTVEIDEDTFASYVATSGTITFIYTTDWTPALTNYGITVTGTPVANDTIVVEYVAEDRGTITTATPTTFNSTGWNLYNNTTGYAKVVAYSAEYGYRIGGTYSLLQFSTTINGAKTAISVSGGLFNVSENGYVWVTGGDATTYIYPIWSDWGSGYQGTFQTYTVTTIDLAEIMVSFPYGLCAVGETRDEINLNAQRAIQRIDRVAYSAANLATVISAGVPYIYDTNYIYFVLETPVTISIDADGTYTVSDHGIEFFTNTTIPVYTEILYGENLKDKLRTDVLTISAQELNASQKAQVLQNIGAVSKADFDKVIPIGHTTSVANLVARVQSVAESCITIFTMNTSLSESLSGVSGTSFGIAKNVPSSNRIDYMICEPVSSIVTTGTINTTNSAITINRGQVSSPVTWDSTNTDTSTATAIMYKDGKWRMLIISFAPKVSASSYTSYGTISSGNRPPTNIYTTATNTKGTAHIQVVRIGAGGTISMQGTSMTLDENYTATITYLVP